ncbi:MFS transporter [Mycobacterium parmense]|uniref:MFS transporter n=1 Tax=Mycobacterium parmense TaxID=185642 RepID=A0A7I7YQB1_9MYCO|nr:nitrate/nitrite transporter [Mycobacterium parmense]MCV7349868.1 NarK/NasA family nitrate transporter [Mycobacterium parmense]ORW51005.1 MFS transporter [Mycobacterium parmense]BBZ43477.1 MFS transporter [Mycobacterium parmense]
MSRAQRISNWDPEDAAAWDAGNKKIARRNLIWSVFAMHVGYSVWSIWSVLVLFMPRSVYGLSPADKLLLGATATLVGGCLRIPYAVAVAKFGGRNWMVFSSAVLLIPTVGTILLLANPGQPLWMYVVCAALTGMGGGNFSAAIANVNVFYPQRRKGVALGIAGGGGNLGVPVIQIVGLIVLASAGNRQPYWVCAIYLVLLSLAALASALFLDNVELPRGEHKPMRSALVQRDTWILAMLYVATYGSFIGFSFAFGQVLQMDYLATGQTTLQASLHAAQVAFLGPLLASLSRMYGGRLSDRLGGGTVTLGVLLSMIVAVSALIVVSVRADERSGQLSTAIMTGYIIGFMALFVLCGVGNGAVYKMIPAVFEARSRRTGLVETERRHWARAMSGVVIGIVAAIGTLGGVVINMTLRQSYLSTGSETTAFCVFLLCYLVGSVLTWWMYVRRSSDVRQTVVTAPAAPDLSEFSLR